MILIGSHVSLGGAEQFLGSVKEAISYHANAFMVYTGAPQNTARKPISELQINEAHQLMKSENILQEHVIVHAPYIVNLANPDPEKQEFAVEFLAEEVRRTAALGSKTLVLHPGAHMKDGPEKGVERIARGVNRILSMTAELDVVIALEGMAGKGTEVGRNFNELAEIIRLVHNQSRIGVCLDTCHSHDAGYDVINDFDGVLDLFDQTIGLSFLKVIHVNDSKNIFDSHKDRHENIGFGFIGFESLIKIIYHPLLAHLPKILETPYIPSMKNDKFSYPPYLHEIEMIQSKKFNPNLKEEVLFSYEGGL
ncbi:MAG: deoxyribonuclease IV [Firmicutes bacterium]|nr:deoxyribonuclease IV [Bacillota bacterium]